MAAQAMIEALDGEGRVGIIDYPEVESVILRMQGFSDELAEHFNRTGRRAESVSRLPGTGTRDRGFRAAEDMLQAHPRLDGLFAINDPSAVSSFLPRCTGWRMRSGTRHSQRPNAPVRGGAAPSPANPAPGTDRR